MKKLKRKTLSIIIIGSFFLFAGPLMVYASETAGVDELDISILDEIDFDEINALTEEDTFAEFNFRELVERLISGEEIDKKWLFQSLIDLAFNELTVNKNYMIQILLIAIAFSVLNNFVNVFDNAAVTDISFYIVYMILLTLLMQSFLSFHRIITEALSFLLEFMKALLPVFSMTMVFSAGSLTTTGFYQITLFIIYLIEWIFIYIAVPAIHIYVMLELINYMTKEELISKTTELLKSSVVWGLKFLFTLVVGINVVQGLLSPAIDSFKSSMLAKTASVLPGIGTSIHAVSEIMVGSGIIIKNGVGVAGIIMMVFLSIGPMIKVGVMALLYKLVAAVIQPVSDKRISGCINGVGEGARLMSRVMVTANVMFLVTIAIVTAATTWNR